MSIFDKLKSVFGGSSKPQNQQPQQAEQPKSYPKIPPQTDMIWSGNDNRELPWFIGEYPNEAIRAYEYTQTIYSPINTNFRWAQDNVLNVQYEDDDKAGLYFGKIRLGDALEPDKGRLISMIKDWRERDEEVMGMLLAYNSRQEWYRYQLAFYKPLSKMTTITCNLSEVAKYRDNYMNVQVGSHIYATTKDEESSKLYAFLLTTRLTILGSIPLNTRAKLQEEDYNHILGVITDITYKDSIIPDKVTVNLYPF